MRVVISQAAEMDLTRIYAYIATDHGPDLAENFRVHAEKALAQLGQHPNLGPHPGWATRHKRLRFWVISRTSYIIYYEASDEEISIERVLDGRRDVRRVIELGIEDRPET
jgi:plasmid stabilization system protein ParE